ncbi:hypothetical protein WJU23_16960 [Prosthecobacter sp. SYSU 5D2]|uniref:hypothetical protein n=1 Tax=Prosthecobacter sp. SYSU 5D2 TaxID=3134134 RepID=UPI0031FE4BDB
MSHSSTASDPATIIEALAATGTGRPAGMVDWMHYGFALRYGEAGRGGEGAAELWQLEEGADALTPAHLAEILPLYEARAWTAGALGLRRLPDLLGDALTPAARGCYLAGLSGRLQSGEGMFPAEPHPCLPEEILPALQAADLDARCAAEIGANAIRTDCTELLLAVLDHPQFHADGSVLRVCGFPDQERFSRQISQLATRVLDVLLEAAVRCRRPAAMRVLLERGACPDLPCWNLERSYNEWFSLLSFAVHELGQDSSRSQGREMTDLLLQHGASPQGLECEGLNNPLMHAMRSGQWEVADRLLELGARFEGGSYSKPDDCKINGPLIPGGHPLIGYPKKDLDWVERAIRPLLPLADLWQVPLYYKGNGQGGQSATFLHYVLDDTRLPLLKKYEALGLSTCLTPALFIDIVRGGHYQALLYLLRDHPHLPRLVFRIRRRQPDFGTSQRQLWLCQPEPDGKNDIPDFQPGDQTPLQLPDGSRIYAHLACIAPPHHHHGPVTGGCFWLEKIQAVHRRRGNCILTRQVRRMWRMEPVPANEYQVKNLIPLVKEVDGRFIWLGIDLNSLSYGLKVPPEWKPVIQAWANGAPGQHLVQAFIERGRQQRESNIELPLPVLDEEELSAYPSEFWPYLCLMDDGTIGVTEKSSRQNPDMLDLYCVWEWQNKPDRDFVPDPRLREWPWWAHVPVRLRPYFYFDELLGVPSVTYQARNAYEKQMIHLAVQWKNARMVESLTQAGIISS